MKAYVLLIFLVGTYSTLIMSASLINNNPIIETIFGERGLNSANTEKNKIENLLNNITVSTASQLYCALDLAVPQLQLLVQKNGANVNIHVNNFILSHQIEHLQQYKKKIAQGLNFYQRLELKFEKTFKKLHCYLKKLSTEKKACWEEILADQIVDFCNFERENILLHYHKLLKYFVHSSKTHLPEIINFWSSRSMQGELVTRVKSVTPEAKVQFLSELFMLALQSFLMGGNGMYIQWLDEEDQKIFEEYQTRQSEIEKNFEVYVQHLNKVKKNLVNQIFNGFKAGLQKINDERKKANTALAQEQLYLLKSINLSGPAIHLLLWPPIPYDQMFEASRMNTPVRQPWYNIYQQGDWEFDATSQSFFQNALVPFGQPFWQKDFETLQKPGETSGVNLTDPSRNSIFTEYISNDKSYEISVECTLLNCSYPFFVGIQFNRGRWISGDPERLWQYRLVGFYGTQSNEKDSSTRSINLGFAQQIITFENNKEQIISPLEQIARAQSTDDHIFYALSKVDVNLLVKDAITFVFDITTSPDSVTIVVSKKGQEQLIKKTFNNIGSTIALYGGVGFISAGAQAEFKLLKPEKLVFTTADLEGK